MTEATLGLVLAGGLARRMGGRDKIMLRIGDRTILDRTLTRFSPQCIRTIISANGDPARFSSSGLKVIADDVAGFVGPLAGILAGLDWAARNMPEIAWVASVPGDCPFLPRDLVARLHAARASAGSALACARSGGRLHPVTGLWSVALRTDLRRALVDEGMRKAQAWTARHETAVVDWPVTPLDPFLNINTPDDLALAQTLAPLDP